jgi:hypothetical protein
MCIVSTSLHLPNMTLLIAVVQSTYSGALESAIPLDDKNVLRCENVRIDPPTEQELADWQVEWANMNHDQQSSADQEFEQDEDDRAQPGSRSPTPQNCTGGTLERRNNHHNEQYDHPERSPARQDDYNRNYHPNPGQRHGPDDPGYRPQHATFSHGYGNNNNHQNRGDGNNHPGHGGSHPNQDYHDNRQDRTNWDPYSQRLGYPQEFGNRNNCQGRHGWDYRLQRGPQRLNDNDNLHLQDNHSGGENWNTTPCLDYPSLSGKHNNYDNHDYAQGSNSHDGSYYQNQSMSRSRNLPKNRPQSPQDETQWSFIHEFGDDHDWHGNALGESQKNKTMQSNYSD